MPTIHDLKQSRFLTKEDVIKPVLVTISGYRLENVAMEGRPPENKYCLEFQELDKPMTLNNINGQSIAEITGAEDFDGWIGARIVLYADPNVMMGTKRVGGIRIRAPKPQAVSFAPTTPKPAPPKPRPAPAPAPVEPNEVSVAVDDDEVPF